MAHETPNFDSRLDALTDVARRERASRARRQRQDRSVTAALSGTFSGTLAELVETAAPITLLTRTGSTLRGKVDALGSDVVVLSLAEANARVLVRVTAIEGIREIGSGHDRDEAPDTGPSLAELLDDFSSERSTVAITLASGNCFKGVVLRVGVDQVVLSLPVEADSMTLPIDAIDQIVAGR